MLWKSLLQGKEPSADGRPYLHLRPAPFPLVLLPFHSFASIKFSRMPASGASSSFLLRLFQPHPAQNRDSTGHRGGWTRTTRPLLGSIAAATPPAGKPVGFQPVTQALHLPKQRLGHANALPPMPLTQAPPVRWVHFGWMPGARQAALSLPLLSWKGEREHNKTVCGSR